MGPVARDGAWSAAGGHLEKAATKTRRRGVVWTATPPPLQVGESARYRFVGETVGGAEATRWHRVAAASWEPSRGELRVLGPSGGQFVADSVMWFADDVSVFKVRFALQLRPDEHVVGFGERFDRVDQRGHPLDAVVFEQYKDQAQTGRTYLPIPFAHVIGANDTGWGFHVRTSHRVWFDVGATTPDLLWIEVDTGESLWPQVELDTFAGEPADVLAAFFAATAMPADVPDWVFRLWISGNEWNTQDIVMAQADRHRHEGVPFGAMVIEAWSDESTFCFFRDSQYEIHADGAPHNLADITFPADGAWPDPKAMIDELHSRDVKVLLWQIPLQKMRPRPAAQAAADAARMVSNGYCVSETDGRPYRNRGWWFPLALMPDFTNAEVRDWWVSKRRYLVDELGVDGFKTDGGEHAWGADLRYHDGTRGAESNNRFPVLYASTYHELLRSCGKPGVTFSRAGHAGAQAFPCHWAGDENSTWAAFEHSVTAGITAGASGIVYWGWDIAGFSGEIPDAELYVRATQASCFMPIMQYHAEFNHHRLPSRDRTPWNISDRHDSPAVLDIFRRYAHLREALVPYLAEQAPRGVNAGKPLMRGMFFEVPGDPAIWAYPQQFFLGHDILVAPVTKPGVVTWPVYLPAGEWIDLFRGAEHAGGELEYELSAEEIPVFVRQSAWPDLQHLSVL
jgi:1,3-alpha-isomaltosidase